MLSDRDKVPAADGRGVNEARNLRLAFNEFGWESVLTQADQHEIPLERYVSDACEAYAARQGGTDISLRPPRFKLSQGEVRELRISLRPQTWVTLETEMGDIQIERLIEHATICGLAAESGPAVSRTVLSAPAAPAGAGMAHTISRHGLSGHRRVAAAAAFLIALPLVPAGLAAAGVSLPDPINRAFEAVGLELPNQAGDGPPVVDDANAPDRDRRSGTARAAGNGESQDAGSDARAGKRGRRGDASAGEGDATAGSSASAPGAPPTPSAIGDTTDAKPPPADSPAANVADAREQAEQTVREILGGDLRQELPGNSGE